MCLCEEAQSASLFSREFGYLIMKPLPHEDTLLARPNRAVRAHCKQIVYSKDKWHPGHFWTPACPLAARCRSAGLERRVGASGRVPHGCGAKYRAGEAQVHDDEGGREGETSEEGPETMGQTMRDGEKCETSESVWRVEVFSISER